MSPMIFNAVMDELLSALDSLPGVKVGEGKVTSLAYADDILLIASSVYEAELANYKSVKKKSMNVDYQ